jgi:aspartate 1-decarboxylase
MLHVMCKAKLHRLTVTAAELDYEGSVTIDRALLDAVGILPYEMVQITNMANGTLWRTYVMTAARGSGIVCLNGPPARHFHPGDQVIVVSHAYYTPEELEGLRLRVAFVNAGNHLVRVEEHRIADA